MSTDESIPDQTIQIKIELKTEDEKEMFWKIHKTRGSKFYSETIRFCINTVYDIYQSKESLLELNSILVNEIKRLIARPDIQNKFLTNNVEGFVTKILDERIDEIRDEIKHKSLYHWELLTNLSEIEREVASAFVRCQNESESKMATVHDVAYQMNKRDTVEIGRILDHFVFMGLLEVDTINNERTYHAIM